MNLVSRPPRADLLGRLWRKFAALALVLMGCAVFQPVHALSWLDVIGAAQGTSIPNANPSDPGASARPPANLNGGANMGTDTSANSSFTCPSAGLDVLSAGLQADEFTDITLVGGWCRCTVRCCTFFGCFHPRTFGQIKSYWSGTHLMEVVRQRGCSPIKGGIVMPMNFAPRSSGGEDGFYHVHVLPNPTFVLPKAVHELLCHIPAALDVPPIYYSELDLIWNPSTSPASLASPTFLDIVAPDPLHVAKKALWSAGSQAIVAAEQFVESLACVGECLYMSWPINGEPITALGNCSGCNGVVAPYNGKPTGVGGRRAAELLAHRAINLNMNSNNPIQRWLSTSSGALCNGGAPRPSPLFPKSEFRLQLIHPAIETAGRKLGAKHVPVADEVGKQGPFVSQDYVFQLWKRRSCCMSFRYCSPVPS
jgi:TraU protein